MVKLPTLTPRTKKALKVLSLSLALFVIATPDIFAQAAGAGGAALSEAKKTIGQYIPLVRDVIYAIAGVVALVGAISVYIKMNNEEQDVKNILVLQNWLERIRKEVTNKVLSIKRISDFLIFPILAQPTLKKI